MKHLISLLFLFVSFLFSCQSQPQGAVLDSKSFYDQMHTSSDPVILDVRTPGEFTKGYIDQAINIDYNDPSFKAEIQKLDKRKDYFVYCLAGSRSRSAAAIMRQNGFEHVYELKGGTLDWQKNSYPLLSPSSASVPDKISMEEYSRWINSSELVVIDYYAPWCGPCKKMEPMLNELTAEYKGKASIIRLNIDENRQLAKELKVEVIPILKIFRQGQETWTHNGFIEKSDLIKAMGI